MSSSGVVSGFVGGLDEDSAAAVDRLVAVIGQTSERLDAAVKRRRLTFAHGGDFHHWLCGIAVTKRSVDLVFHFGGILDDPDGRLIAGTSKFLRKLEFKTPDDVDSQVLLGFLEQALDRLQFFKENWRAVQSG